jgi:hypothetical protein
MRPKGGRSSYGNILEGTEKLIILCREAAGILKVTGVRQVA